MRIATRLAAAILGLLFALAHAGHDDVRVDRALERYAGIITELGAPDAEGRIYSFRSTPIGPPATTPKEFTAGALHGWRLTFLGGKRFASAFEVQSNTASEITVSAAQGPLDGVAVRDVFVVENIPLAQ